MSFMSYDPWASVVSRNGIPGDELVSMLQKAIRRGLERDAMIAAYEMHISSPQFSDKMWRRLLCISVEDIGFGEVRAPEVVMGLYNMHKEFPYTDGDQPIFFVQAIRYLCRCKKERTSDHLKNMMVKEFQHGFVPQVPDYAYDMHTTKGRAMGRDEMHFLTEASRVSPQLEDPEVQKIHDEYLEFCRKESAMRGRPLVEAFTTNGWQY